MQGQCSRCQRAVATLTRSRYQPRSCSYRWQPACGHLRTLAWARHPLQTSPRAPGAFSRAAKTSTGHPTWQPDHRNTRFEAVGPQTSVPLQQHDSGQASRPLDPGSQGPEARHAMANVVDSNPTGMQITFLGTGAGAITHGRCAPSFHIKVASKIQLRMTAAPQRHSPALRVAPQPNLMPSPDQQCYPLPGAQARHISGCPTSRRGTALRGTGGRPAAAASGGFPSLCAHGF